MVDVKVPSVGESISEVTIASWLKKDGDIVKLDEAICSIESDKATLEISAPKAGKLKILVKEGETVAIGTKVAEVDETASAGASAPAAAAPAPAQEAPKAAAAPASTGGDKNYPSPAASKILAEKGVDASSVQGSGKDGRITKADAMGAQAAPAGATASDSSLKSLAHQTMASSFSREIRREKMTGLRKTIASRLVAAKNTTAMLTTFNEVDMSAVMELRKKYKDSFKDKHGVGLGFMSFFTKAACAALKQYPAVNGMIDGNEIVFHNYADVGVAVSTPRGLVVPVIRNAESMGMAAIESKIIELATRARDGKITIEEMQNGTFTITNGGIFGSMLSTPILNAPQSAILGLHNIVERPVAVNGQVVIRPIMYLALSYDHRIIDGRESVSFLKAVKEMIEDPARLLLDI
ncbi:2-oxoglutarate dehydrogenase complex dihydrolipoyllysine-residue succinyltransferase [Peredibacter starrii]|uniref:Dihydrolipoyllysine-residue succinyltransferase component of 2-oxoglutarate dehydrogenase complex n=1 Tax=Peredibacter starrii TaxID=28202 RepID=A0AAX4HJC5_9BACT|nr:2-oxoglutarate dehydrogenase complex dihydrolipoyllysine-residue succinyltransferase [Peredibacter starrii]WPU63320.1 2-oxoglutarate dehydrogenase complex dihydrolipoyllysine-residue succinyltransferase [Peredibacter starrii]